MKYKLVISDRKVDGHSLDEVENHQKNDLSRFFAYSGFKVE